MLVQRSLFCFISLFFIGFVVQYNHARVKPSIAVAFLVFLISWKLEAIGRDEVKGRCTNKPQPNLNLATTLRLLQHPLSSIPRST
jgi:hypothetical protein